MIITLNKLTIETDWRDNVGEILVNGELNSLFDVPNGSTYVHIVVIQENPYKPCM